MSRLTVKCISLWQPWASLMAHGFKQYETRSWSPRLSSIGENHGILGIHAARRSVRHGEMVEYHGSLISQAITSISVSFASLPYGSIVGVGVVDKVFNTEGIRDNLTPDELAFGNYGDGRFAWRMSRVVGFKYPMSLRGWQGLWNWEVPDLCADVINKLNNCEPIEENALYWYKDHQKSNEAGK